MIVTGIIKRFGELISKAEERTIESIEDGRLETEPSITERFLREMENVINEHGRYGNIVFRARSLRDRGPGAQEKRYGADFVGVLDAQLESFAQKKGFLSQAKMDGHGINVALGPYGLTTICFPQNDEFRRLKEQVSEMLSITPDSFVIVYSRKGFVTIPASSIAGLKSKDAVYGKPIDRFFKEFIMCFVGDHRLKAWDDHSLEEMRRETNARNAIIYQILEANKDDDRFATII